MGGTREKEADSCPKSHLDLLTSGPCDWPGLGGTGEQGGQENLESLGRVLKPVGAPGGRSPSGESGRRAGLRGTSSLCDFGQVHFLRGPRFPLLENGACIKRSLELIICEPEIHQDVLNDSKKVGCVCVCVHACVHTHVCVCLKRCRLSAERSGATMWP